MELGPRTPIGVVLHEVAARLARAFDQTLTAHGAGRPVWFVLLALQSRRSATQRELAAAIGIREATLSHHLSALEARGIVVRHRDQADRRVQRIALTPDGDALFTELRRAATAFDARLRSTLGEGDVDALRTLLLRLLDAVPTQEAPPDATGHPPLRRTH
ncbi:MarR family winged helix-turn-helix transcriptional regulator [Xylanimonas sp. McL0601]|uniref:MarR family winged helix-turn-helix transcriptional regulator n=1 Tax=Xylanimonas sp. McL0601 TaxID=3414739 RepID=UPI003CF6C409